MSVGSYVVYLDKTDEPPFKVFDLGDARRNAETFAARAVQEGRAEAAEILFVPGVDNARAAVAAVQMGEGRFVALKTQKLTPEEQKRAQDLAFERAWAEGGQKPCFGCSDCCHSPLPRVSFPASLREPP